MITVRSIRTRGYVMSKKTDVNDNVSHVDQDADWLYRFPIRVLSERTGIGSSTLRAWERRYGLLQPERTPKGHRLYREQDVKRIERIVGLLDENHTLPGIASLLNDEQEEKTSGSPGSPLENDAWSALVEQTLTAVREFSTERIEAIFNESASLYPFDLVTERLIEPVLKTLGDQWDKRPAGIAEEHFYTGWLNHRLGARFHHASSQATGARIVCACLPGSYHDIGLKLFSISALMRGYRILYFGANLPLEQIPYILERSAARGVVLAANRQNDSGVFDSLARLMHMLEVPVFLGGTDGMLSDTGDFEQAGGIVLGNRIAVSLRVLGTHVPAH